jgi:4-amino-4-deoxy-L-arabinose transferase-like glycosyltransferase
MLFLALLLAAFSTVKDRQTAGRYALAGLLLGLAFLTKQTVLVAAAPLVGYALWRDKLKALPMPVVGIVIAGGVSFMLHQASSGWSSFYIFELPSGHAWLFSNLISFWTEDLMGALGIAVIVAVAGILGMPSDRRAWWLFVMAGVGSAAFLSRLHEGGHVNVLIPLYAVGATLFGIGAVRLRAWTESLRPQATIAASALLYGAICVQLVSLASKPAAQVPSRAHAEAGERVEAFMRAQSGPLYAPAHGYLAARSGHASGAHAMAVWDILRTDLEERARLKDDFAEALTEQRFERIMFPELFDIGLSLDDPHAESLYVRIDSLGGSVLRGAEAFRPVTGHPERPGAVYAPVLE